MLSRSDLGLRGSDHVEEVGLGRAQKNGQVTRPAFAAWMP
jgi:hypothetical protein